MIELHLPMSIKHDPIDGWQLIFWAGNPSDYTTPFRAMLAEIANALGLDAQRDLRLPVYEDGEDFVEGTLHYGDAVLRIYYEHSLGYLALMSENEVVVQSVAERIRPHVNEV